MRGEDLEIHRNLAIPASELIETASRSSGPGGQHVNKTSTRVSLRWNVARSAVLSDAQRRRLSTRLASTLTRDGDLVVHAGRARSRAQNRQAARERLAERVGDALRVATPRLPTRATRASRRRRLDTKRQRGDTKRQRRRPTDDG
jgi:ribosome-associated protein